MGRHTTTLAIAIASALPVSAAAQNGAYFEMAFGAVVAPGMRVTGTDNDVGTKCDLIINPTGAETNGECDTQPPPTDWYNEVGGARGLLAGLTAGYAARRVRLEAEYLYRSAAYNARAPTVIGDVVTLDKAEQELEVADGGVGDVIGHHWFANVYFHVAPGRGCGLTSESARLGPHVARLHQPVEAQRRSRRHHDLRRPGSEGEDRGHDDDRRRQAVGLDVRLPAARGRRRCRDGRRLAGREGSAGRLRSVREWGPRVAAAAKPRFHGRPGHRVVYSVSTDDTSFWTVSFNMRYHW